MEEKTESQSSGVDFNKSDDNLEEKHEVEQSQANTNFCKLCKREFKRRHFMRHMRRHAGIKPHVCNECGKAFTDNSTLQKHLSLHTGDRPFVCNVCNKGFSSGSDLRKHLLIHSGEKNYSCNICMKSFTQLGHLNGHMISHTKEKLYTCEICGSEFSYKTSIEKHMSVHLRTNIPFEELKNIYKNNITVCPVCKEDLLTLSNLDNHLRSHSIKLTCELCGSSFLNKRKLDRHKFEMHSEVDGMYNSYPCTVCEKVFRFSSALLNHMKTHKERILRKCEFCDKEFPENHVYRRHLEKHSRNDVKKVVCAICKEVLKNEYQFRIHRLSMHKGERPFTCKFCNRTFALEKSFKRHKPKCRANPEGSSESHEEVVNEDESPVKVEIGDIKEESIDVEDDSIDIKEEPNEEEYYL